MKCMYECMVRIQQTYCHGYLTLLSNRSTNTEIDIVPVPLRSITFHSESLYTRRSLMLVSFWPALQAAVSIRSVVSRPYIRTYMGSVVYIINQTDDIFYSHTHTHTGYTLLFVDLWPASHYPFSSLVSYCCACLLAA